MSEQTIYLYEFLYRGRPPGADAPPAYHVILAQESVDAFGHSSTVTSAAMTPDQAQAAGFALPAILSQINSATMAETEELRSRLAACQTKLEEAEAKVSMLEARIAVPPEVSPIELPSPPEQADEQPA